MSDATNGAYVAGQSLSNRIWRNLGYFGSFNEAAFDWRQEVPKDGDLLTTVTTVRFSFLDRLRLLVSGHCEVSVYTKTLVPIGKTETMSEVRVLP